jgi:hypothetical protein
MPILAEPGRFFTIEDGSMLRAAVELTCRALGVGNKETLRKEITVRAADLTRSGLRTPEAIRDRIILEARALSDIAA